MMQTEYAVCMSQLIMQYEEIKITSTHALDLLYAWAEDGDSIQLDKMRHQVLKFCQLCFEHTKQEEETIIPLLKEIYGANEDISEFVRNEHAHILHDLSTVAETILETKQPTDETVQMISRALNQLLEHKFIEEQALYPLVQTHINKKKLS